MDKLYELYVVEHNVVRGTFHVQRLDLVLHRNLNSFAYGQPMEWSILAAAGSQEEANRLMQSLIDQLKEEKVTGTPDSG